MLWTPFDIEFVSQKAVKRQVVANFLAAQLCLDNEELPDDLLDDGVMLVETKLWRLYFDGIARNRGAGMWIVFITPSGGLIHETCSNNKAEYEALIIGLELAIEMHID